MISLLIPTIERSDFIIKYLKFLKKTNFSGQVLIGDSSNSEHFERTKQFVNDFVCDFEVKQYSHPNLYPHQCIQRMIADVTEDYCMYICDDDLLVVETLVKCIEFLDNNSDYSGVGGVAILAKIDENDYSKVISTSYYQTKEVLEESARERLNNLMRGYTVVAYSLARTEQFKERWPTNEENYDKGLGGELLPCAVLASQGKVKMLDEIFVVRQIHERRIILPNIFDTILQPKWAASVSFAIEYVAGIISRVDSIPFEEAKKSAKNSWRYYLESAFSKPHSEKFGTTHLIRRIWGKSMRILSGTGIFQYSKDLSLPSLLNPSSKYHKGFISAYETITKE